jgi:type II secretion system protein J
MTPRRPAIVFSRRGRAAGGFSLLELVLAMGVTAMLALALYTAMHVALRARKSAQAAVEPTRAGAVAADIIGRDLDNVPPPTGILAGPFVGTHATAPTAGGGDGDDLQFYTLGKDEPADDTPLDEGVRKVELTISTDYDPPALVRRVTRNLLASTEPLVNEEVLCRNVRSFSLTYYDGYAWQDSWDSTGDNVLPLAVAMTLQINDPAATDPLSAPPRTVTRVFPIACGKVVDDTGFGGLP